MTISVYSKPSCVQCTATKKALERAELEFEIFDVTEDRDAYDTVMKLGYLQAPVVIAGEEHWSGFQPDRIAALAERVAS
ncbi:glutaredoxin-like protein NrdH [Demequina rhizosphaerae]|uniref:glutaredoxin-like protein NrdH n=1 Tax=Demequina rhizosphaerae TaxID=1638985 RepID=UPI0007846FED|nr:glutaredoxin-like protein NrdH [Demequina rhizosphaerae]